MGLSRSSKGKRALGTLAIAAGGFTAGGLAMSVSLAVSGPQPVDVGVVLQDAGVPGPLPAGQPGDAAPASSTSAPADTVRAVAKRAASTPAPTRTKAATTRRVAPRTVVTRAQKPPVVHSTGS